MAGEEPALNPVSHPPISTERKVQWERRFQSVMVSLTVAGVVWAAQTLLSVRDGVTAMSMRTVVIESKLAQMEENARRDSSDVGRRIEAVETRVLRLELKPQVSASSEK